MKPVHVFSDWTAMADEIALRWCHQAQQAVESQRIFTVVLSGGSSAARIFQGLVESSHVEQIPWRHVHIFWADERCVSPDSGESNYGAFSRILLNRISVPEENLHRIRGEDNPAKEALRYARDIQDHMVLRKGQANFFDWVLLGVGADGHTASLFPHQQNLLHTQDLCGVARHPQTGQERITLTPRALKQSAHIVYHVIGEEKAQIVFDLLSDSPSPDYPATHIAGEWYLDRPSAARLS